VKVLFVGSALLIMAPAIRKHSCLEVILSGVCLFLFQVVWRMRELIGRTSAADIVSFKVQGRLLSRGKSGNFKFV